MPMYDWTFQGSRDTCYTDVDVLLTYADRFDEAKLRGCIFHMSRCGSTAIANAFRSVERTLVISESRGLSGILLDPRYGGLAVEPELKRALALGFLGAVLKTCPAASVILKFPSVMSMSIPETLSVLPAPWCFSSRQPAEVIRSLQRSPGGWLAEERGRERALRILGYAGDDAQSEAELCEAIHVRLLERYLTTALAACGERTICLDYEDLRADTVMAVVRFMLGSDAGDSAPERVADSLRYYSKAPARRAFVPDVAMAGTPTGYAPLDRAYEDYRRNAPFVTRLTSACS